MQYLVIGGFGYLASIITDLLKNDKHKVDVLDNLFWSNQYVTELIKYDKWFFENKDVDYDKYDCVVWAANIDVDSFYEEKIFEGVLKKNKALFSHVLKTSKKFLNLSTYLLSYDNDIESEMFKHFRSLEKEVKDSNKGINVRVPALCGPSPRMRWDTNANQIIYDFIVSNRIILEDGWLTKIPICSVLDMAIHVKGLTQLDLSILTGSFLRTEYYSEKYSLVELAHLLATTNSECEIKTLVVPENIRLEGFRDDYKFEQSYLDAYQDIVRNLGKEDNGNFMTDLYNNETMLSTAISSFELVKKLG